jgi:hypothetical protein
MTPNEIIKVHEGSPYETLSGLLQQGIKDVDGNPNRTSEDSDPKPS